MMDKNRKYIMDDLVFFVKQSINDPFTAEENYFIVAYYNEFKNMVKDIFDGKVYHAFSGIEYPVFKLVDSQDKTKNIIAKECVWKNIFDEDNIFNYIDTDNFAIPKITYKDVKDTKTIKELIESLNKAINKKKIRSRDNINSNKRRDIKVEKYKITAEERNF